MFFSFSQIKLRWNWLLSASNDVILISNIALYVYVLVSGMMFIVYIAHVILFIYFSIWSWDMVKLWNFASPGPVSWTLWVLLFDCHFGKLWLFFFTTTWWTWSLGSPFNKKMAKITSHFHKKVKAIRGPVPTSQLPWWCHTRGLDCKIGNYPMSTQRTPCGQHLLSAG